MAALSAEMNVPHITTSALRAMHQLAPRSRKLDFIDPFYGYAYSWCGCRFPESRPPQGDSAAENSLLNKFHREKQFSQHICSERPTGKTGEPRRSGGPRPCAPAVRNMRPILPPRR
jgi:hypothetical protein